VIRSLSVLGGGLSAVRVCPRGAVRALLTWGGWLRRWKFLSGFEQNGYRFDRAFGARCGRHWGRFSESLRRDLAENTHANVRNSLVDGGVDMRAHPRYQGLGKGVHTGDCGGGRDLFGAWHLCAFARSTGCASLRVLLKLSLAKNSGESE